MNILQIVPNKGWGGGEKYVWELSRSLSEAGHAVSVVIPPCDILAKKFAGMDTATLRFRGPYDLGAIRRLARLVRKTVSMSSIPISSNTPRPRYWPGNCTA